MVDWQAWETVGLAIDAFGGLLYFVMGVAVMFVRPLSAAARWFAVFAIPWGIEHIIRNLYDMGAGVPAWYGVPGRPPWGLVVAAIFFALAATFSAMSLGTTSSTWLVGPVGAACLAGMAAALFALFKGDRSGPQSRDEAR